MHHEGAKGTKGKAKPLGRTGQRGTGGLPVVGTGRIGGRCLRRRDSELDREHLMGDHKQYLETI
jgi:hypothetical protein